MDVFSWTGSTEILTNTLRVESITWDMNKSRFLISSEAITLLSKFQERGQNVVKGERTRRKERKWRPQITVPTAKLQPSRATVLTQPSQLKDMHRPPRRMGKKAMEPMESLLMSAIPRLRALPPTGRLHM